MDLRKLKTLIDLVSDSNVSELEITEAEGKVRIVKGGGSVVHTYGQPMYQQMPQGQMPAAPVAAPAVVEPVAEAVATGHTVKSPMVGTFYRSASPGAKAFAEIGSVVKEGDTICIIEAMKVMNEIKAEIAGKVVEIVAENGKPVQFGQVLFRVS